MRRFFWGYCHIIVILFFFNYQSFKHIHVASGVCRSMYTCFFSEPQLLAAANADSVYPADLRNDISPLHNHPKPIHHVSVRRSMPPVYRRQISPNTRQSASSEIVAGNRGVRGSWFVDIRKWEARRRRGHGVYLIFSRHHLSVKPFDAATF